MATELVVTCLARLGSSLDAKLALSPLLPRLLAYDWPGNVRELENIAERLAVFLLQYESMEEVDCFAFAYDCPELFADTGQQLSLEGSSLPLTERVREAMQATGGNRAEAARRLGVSRSTLWRWLRDLRS